ncbi:MAG: hypothetical protein QXK07_01815, partial [Desulfurococcaceae archaeon]
SSMNTPTLYSALPSTSTHEQQVQKQHQVSSASEKTTQMNNKTTVQLTQEYESLQPPSKPPTKQSTIQSVPTASIIKQEVNVPLNVVEQWILLELKQTAGILDLSAFEKKYGVPRALVLEALRSLESKSVVKVRRK